MLVVDRAAFEEVGGFDERYFLYVEDLDLWDRLLSAGGRCGFAPSVRAFHDSAQGSDASAVGRTVLRWVGVETFIASRRPRRWRIYRMAHRVGLRLLSNTDDDMVQVVRTGFAAGRNPAGVQDDVRSCALGARGAAPSRRLTRLGWARTRVELAVSDLVLDVGSGAFPNPRADVLCERSPVRHHRTAVTDRPFVVADAQALPFRSGAFDFVIASHVAEHVADPALFCVELDRVAGSGYLETPSPLFEKIFPERNHLWTVRSVGRGQLRFESNTSRQGTRGRVTRIAYALYYAGQAKEVRTFQAQSLVGRFVARLAFVVRGTLNRMGVTVTRCRFGGMDRLSAEVRD